MARRRYFINARKGREYEGKSFNLSLSNLIFRLRKFRHIVNECLDEVMLNNGDMFADAVRYQLQEGFNGKGIPIASYRPYAPYTRRVKKAKRQPVDRVTLRDTGWFYRSLHLKKRVGFFAVIPVGQPEDKVTELMGKYGQEVLRVSDENLKYLLQEIKEQLVERLKNKLLYED